MKVVLLTSSSLRHKYIANQLANAFDLELIITEKKSPKIKDTTSYKHEDGNFVKNHFIKRDESEERFFLDYANFPEKSNVLQVNHKEINNNFVYNVINLVHPDLIVLFGTSIIKNHIIEQYSDKIINLHLGLSPYFKGSATNLFPILYHKLECIGSTIHQVTEKVDAGAILHQLRPDITIEDDIHSIGNKVILKSGIVLPKILKNYVMGNIKPISQNKYKGIICKIKDLTPNVLRDIYNNMNDNLVEKYLKNKNTLEAETPIIQNNIF